MATLTKNEIIAQLERLGINTLAELESYLSEYKQYCIHCNSSMLSIN